MFLTVAVVVWRSVRGLAGLAWRWGWRLLLVVAAVVVMWVSVAAAVYPPEYIGRVLAWRTSDVDDYLTNFDSRPLTASPEPFRFEAVPDNDPASTSVEAALVRALAAAEQSQGRSTAEVVEELLADTDTQALLVIVDDRLVFERYGEGIERSSMLTSFSTAKSFVSTLIGIAVAEGAIASIDDPITDYLPELAERNPEFAQIRVRDLLTMSSGLEYSAFRWAGFNGDDPLTTYHPDQRELCLNQPEIERAPAQEFVYHKCHPQLLGMILERTTGVSVTDFTQTRLWDPLGMEYGGAWTIDSTESGFEKLEAGLNARAIDYAKLGRLFLERGDWNGDQVLPATWVDQATGIDATGRAPSLDTETFGPDRYYGFMWWGWDNPDGTTDYAAVGDRGQYIWVSPADNVIVVRNGREFGRSTTEWVEAFREVAQAL